MNKNRIQTNPDVSFPKQILDLTANVFEDVDEIEIFISDYDLDRIYINGSSGEEYIIRMWNVTEECIRYSLFIDVKDETGSHGEELFSGILV